MTPELANALRRCATTQIKLAEVIASTQGRDLANEIVGAWTELSLALDEPEIKLEPKKSEVFGERVFALKKKAKKN